MSRSRRKRPFRGISSSDSDKRDKRIADRRLRRTMRAALPADAEGVLPALREVSTVWGFAKDEKRRFDPGREPARMRKQARVHPAPPCTCPSAGAIFSTFAHVHRAKVLSVNLIFRLLYVLLGSLRRPRLGPLDESVIRLRVLPNDLDTNLHLNNGRFLTLMDLGRVDLLVRLGVVGEMRRRRWGGVVASATVRFRRPLNLFQRFELHSRLLCWDDRWFYMEQRFVRGGDTAAVAVVKARFMAADGRRLAPAEVVAATRHAMPSPPMPPGVREWVEAEERIQSDVQRRTYEQVG